MPLRVFAAVLILVFGLEYAIMLFIASISPPRHAEAGLEFLDSLLLTTLLAPAIWWLVVRPLQKLFEARGRLLRQLIEAQEEERARISRDLHDELGQQLTAILLSLRAVQEAPTLEVARERALFATGIGADAIDSVRAISRGLRPAVLQDLGLATAIERMCDEFRSVHDVEVVLKQQLPVDLALPQQVETCLYRVLQESLTNAARHSGAGRVDVDISLIGSRIMLRVEDNGGGIVRSATHTGSSGLLGMKERVTMLDGDLRVESHEGRGTSVRASIPLDGLDRRAPGGSGSEEDER